MSIPPKPRGGDQSKAPLSRLKHDTTPEQREWAFSLRSAKNPETDEVLTSAECRGEIREKLGISLGSDTAYSDFCQWYFRNRQWDVLGDLAEQDEATLTDRYPNLSRDKIREAVIKRQYALAELSGDPKFMLKVIKVDQAESTGRSRADLEKEKLQLAKEAEERQRSEHLLNREKFELDVVARAREHAKSIRQIEGNPKLSEKQKVDQIRLRLFGVLPEQNISPTPGT